MGGRFVRWELNPAHARAGGFALPMLNFPEMLSASPIHFFGSNLNQGGWRKISFTRYLRIGEHHALLPADPL